MLAKHTNLVRQRQRLLPIRAAHARGRLPTLTVLFLRESTTAGRGRVMGRAPTDARCLLNG